MKERALLESWHREYTSADAQTLGCDSDLVLSVGSDSLDELWIEQELRRLMTSVEVRDGFCTQCQQLLENWGPDVGWNEKIQKYESMHSAVARPLQTLEIEAAARKGCKFCDFLYFQLRSKGWLDIYRKIEARFRTLQDELLASLSFQDWKSPEQGVLYSQTLWINLPGKIATSINDAGAKFVNFNATVVPPTNTLWSQNLDTYELAKSWIQRCLTSHDGCRTAKVHELPTRLICVSNDVVRLVETKHWSVSPPYATLSYCWGSDPFIALTEENMPSFLDDIPPESLPKTFKDAIQVTRCLGIDYIWIDALCIIQRQEDNSDWKREAGRMQSVFGGAHISLAASAATDVNQGFFLKPDDYRGGFCARVTTQKCSRVHGFCEQDAWGTATTLGPLAHRAWAFQERLLPVRTIYFSDQGIFWGCRTVSNSEFVPDGRLVGPMVRLNQPENLPFSWESIVRQYSPASLTYASDRLPALAGIAACQHGITGDQYLAGHWRDRLLHQLPWVRGRKARCKRPPWRAPTWSWMATDGRSSFLSIREQLIVEEYARIEDAWTTPVGPEPFGAVTGGRISLACSFLLRGVGYYFLRKRNEHLIDDNTETWSESIRLHDETEHFFVTMDSLDDEMVFRDEQSVYMLPLFRVITGGFRKNPTTEEESHGGVSDEMEKEEYEADHSIAGLALQARDEDESCFFRIGSFWVPQYYLQTDFERSKSEKYLSLMRIMEQAGGPLASQPDFGLETNGKVKPTGRKPQRTIYIE